MVTQPITLLNNPKKQPETPPSGCLSIRPQTKDTHASHPYRPRPTRYRPRAFCPSPAALSQKIPCTIAAVNGGFDTEAAYSPELDLWYAQTQDGKKCWNGFGLGAPVAGKKVSLAAEINFPSDGINRALSGAFAAAENGDILVLHRGKIRGGKALFFKYYQGEILTADDGGKPDTFALIGSLNDAGFPAKLAAFVRQILDIKAAAKRDAA